MTAGIVVVSKQTGWQQKVERGDERVRELIERGDPTVARLRAAHDAHVATLSEVERHLSRLGFAVTRRAAPDLRFTCDDASLVITVGGDGTLLAASHNVGDGVPIVGVNSAPGISVGFFCAANRDNIGDLLARFAHGEAPETHLARMQVDLNDTVVSRRVLNEALLCHACPAATSRYIVEIDGETEEHRSSGFWIGPAAGSTAAIRSAGGEVLPLSSQELQFVVREPYTPRGEPPRIGKRLLSAGESLLARSKMDDARLFLDGPHEQLSLGLGDRVRFTRSPQALRVVGDLAAKQRG